MTYEIAREIATRPSYFTTADCDAAHKLLKGSGSMVDSMLARNLEPFTRP